MSKGSAINTEFDSRILRVSSGAAGITRPSVLPQGNVRTYCLHCGKPAGMVTDIPPSIKGDPGILIICDACESRIGRLPGHAIHFTRYAS